MIKEKLDLVKLASGQMAEERTAGAKTVGASVSVAAGSAASLKRQSRHE